MACLHKILIPNPLKIGAYPFKLYFNSGVSIDEAGSYGMMSPRRMEMCFAPSLNEVQLHATFNHEVLHQIDKTFNLHLDESIIDRLAEGLMEFERDTLGIELDWSNIGNSS